MVIFDDILGRQFFGSSVKVFLVRFRQISFNSNINYYQILLRFMTYSVEFKMLPKDVDSIF